MKRPLYFLPLLLACSCNYFYNHIEFTGKATGLTGPVIIEDRSGKGIYGASVKNGAFHIRQQELKEAGYYDLYLPGNRESFEIYLEPGTYDINMDKYGVKRYPAITTSSKIQNELSAYHLLSDSMKHITHDKMNALIDSMNSPAARMMPPVKYQELLLKVKEAQTQDGLAGSTVMTEFIKRYPQNTVISHIMAGIDYQSKPKRYYKIYQTFSEAAKNTDDGSEIGDKLKQLIKLLPGSQMPALVGTTPDGKTVDYKLQHKKFILVEFWRAGITISRKNHVQMISYLLPELTSRGCGIISVSLDTKRDWWVGAIKDDKLTWPQVNDLKGFDSPNVENWGITDIPLYALLDGQGRLIDRDIPLGNVMFTINDCLAHHK